MAKVSTLVDALAPSSQGVDDSGPGHDYRDRSLCCRQDTPKLDKWGLLLWEVDG